MTRQGGQQKHRSTSKFVDLLILLIIYFFQIIQREKYMLEEAEIRIVNNGRMIF